VVEAAVALVDVVDRRLGVEHSSAVVLVALLRLLLHVLSKFVQRATSRVVRALDECVRRRVELIIAAERR